ncbi:MAG: metal-dependent hydrolase, partial [Cyanobacteria bacterium J06649_4]
MPSPIAHSALGYLLGRLPVAKNALPNKVMTLAPVSAIYGVLVSNLPDLDFVPQVITGIRFHRGPSHSVLAALLVSALLALIVRQVRQRARYRSLFTITLGAYTMHIVMDLFTAGGSGLPLLWPLSDRTFRAPFSIFPPVHHSKGLFDLSHFTF